MNKPESPNSRSTEREQTEKNCDIATPAKRNVRVCLSPGSPEGQAVLLTGQAHGGGVHNGHELLDVRSQHAVEELLVPVLQRHQHDVPEGGTEPPSHIRRAQRRVQRSQRRRSAAAQLPRPSVFSHLSRGLLRVS